MMWPLVPNWTRGSKETLSFRTEVLTSRSGKEQRRALRSTPRRALAFEVLAEGDRRRTLEGLLSASLDGAVTMPDFLKGVRTTSALPVSGSTVTVRNVPAWLTPGAAVALSWRRTVYEREVGSVVGLTVTFTAPSPVAIGASALLSPLLSGWMLSGFSASSVTDTVWTGEQDFDVTPGSEDLDEGGADIYWWYEGREILRIKPNRVRAPTQTFSTSAETVDYGRGVMQRVAPAAFNTRVQQASYLRKTAADVLFLKQFFTRMKGQRGEFYLPTWAPDMTIAANVVGGSATITVAGRQIYDDYANDTVHRSIFILMQGGGYYARTIGSIGLSGGNSVLTLTSNWAFDLNAAEIKMISWMPVSRFASDTMTIEWVTDQVAQTVLSIRTLEAAVAEETEDFGELFDYMISTYGADFTENVLCDPLQYAVNVRYPEIAGT